MRGPLLRLLLCSVDAVFPGEDAVHSVGDRHKWHHVAAGAPWTDGAQVGRGPRARTSCAAEKVRLWGWTHYERPRGTRKCRHLGNLTESCISDVFWGFSWGLLEKEMAAHSSVLA